MRKINLLVLSFFVPVIISSGQNFTQYADPMIGTGGHGHTFPGATVPFGMVQLSPDTRVDGSWDGCSGYHYGDSLIYGFSHTHLSGTGCSDYGDIMLMPTFCKKETYDNTIYRSSFLHSEETASPGFYGVFLADHKINVDLTTTTRVGFHRYQVPPFIGGTMNIILDLNHRDELLDGEIKIVGNNRVEGFRRSKAWATDQVIFYSIEFSKPFKGHTLKKDADKDIAANFLFDINRNGDEIMVKVAISPVGVDGAQKNMQAEIPHWNFGKIKEEANDTWNKELGKIEVSGGTKEQMTNFYTALYHTMIAPNIAMDADHRYRGRDNQIHTAEGFSYYTVFSLWDTFRALHPLLTIIDQQRTKDFVQTFLTQYQQGGRLPVWELACNETDCMIGYHSVSVMTDAAAKDLLTKEQILLALEAAKKSATWDHLGLPAMMNQGYIAIEDDHESVSKTLEYAYDDWCITRLAHFAEIASDDMRMYYDRAQAYQNIYDPSTGFFRPRKNGGWIAPFEPREVNNHFTEGNAWQYLFFVPQDIPGLIHLMGGEKKFAAKLDSLFSVTSETTGRDQADITGLIGQYAHGNEPSHGFVYLYNYAGQPWKSQYYLRTIMDSLYHPTADGLPGNEDCGQMSAWFVFSAMGLYPVTPGFAFYTMGTPLFPEMKIHLGNGNTIQIKADGVSSRNRYVQQLKWNNGAAQFPGMFHNHLMKGGTLEFTMSDTRPTYSTIGETQILSDLQRDVFAYDFIPVPAILSTAMAFKGKQLITLQSLHAGDTIYYAVTGEASSRPMYQPYTKPFEITESCTVFAYVKNGGKSKTVSAFFHRIPHEWTVSITSSYNPQYTAGGDNGIIDGLHGDVNWRKGGWQGYQPENFEAVVDLKKVQPVTKISSTYLQDTRAWILMPVKVEYFVSEDNIHFTQVATAQNTVQDNDYTVQIKNFVSPSLNTKARYVKVKAYNYGMLPKWHAGAGDQAFIFVDEIAIE